MGANSIFQERVIQVTLGMFELCSKMSRYLFIKGRRWRKVLGQKKTIPGKGIACKKRRAMSARCMQWAGALGLGHWSKNGR